MIRGTRPRHEQALSLATHLRRTHVEGGGVLTRYQERGKKMRASQRYAKVGSWRVVESKVFYVGGNTEDHAIELVHEVADMRDTQGGYEYSDGMHRVYATHLISQKSAKRVKTFYGELAWSNAERLYGDIYHEYQMADTSW